MSLDVAAERVRSEDPARALELVEVDAGERPAGAQFVQCDIDVLGEPGPRAEAEKILGLDMLVTGSSKKARPSGTRLSFMPLSRSAAHDEWSWTIFQPAGVFCQTSV